MRAGDTITAIATPPGRGGVGVIRISGPNALPIAKRLTGIAPRPRHAHFARFFDADGGVLDEGLLLGFRAPKSFTGEDAAELHAHGSPVVLDMLVKRVLELGARMAEPGEFTRRAFCNDKMDLAQAEAVANLIAGVAAQSARGAMRVLRGEFSEEIRKLRATLTGLLVLAESSIDFSEDAVDFLDGGDVRDGLLAARAQIADLTRRGRQGALLTSGAEIALVGRPNVGKSSLFNRLAQRDEAIVSDAPGTTRDIVKCDLLVAGIPVRVSDTAGLRTPGGDIEAEGAKRAQDAMQSADLALVVFEATQGDTDKERQWLDDLKSRDIAVVPVANKIDLTGGAHAHFPLDAAGVSAKTGEGLDALQRRIAGALGYDDAVDDAIGAHRRHLNALKAADTALGAALAHADDRRAELLAEELQAASRALGEITGEFTTEDLLGKIFARFCVGK